MDNAKAVDNAFSLGSRPVNNAEEVFVTYLGEIEEMGRTRTILGPYVEDYRGFKENSPCWAWQGPYINGRPYVRTHWSSRSVLKMIARQWGRKGRIYQVCQHADCINPLHLGARHYWKHQERDPETKRFA